MGGKNWSRREKDILKLKYPKKSAEVLAEELGRSKYSIYIKASEMGIKSEKCGFGVKWSEEEIEILREKYPFKPASEVADVLNRSVKSVKSKAKSLEVKKKRKLNEVEKVDIRRLYKKEGDMESIASEVKVPLDLVRKVICCKEKLEKLYKERGLTQKEIAGELGVNQPYISERMREYGITTEACEPWSEKEEKILIESYLKVPKGKLLSLLPSRSWSAIKAKALKLGLTRLAEEYRKSERVKEKLRSLAEKNTIQVNFKEKNTLSYVLGVMDGDGFHDKKHTIGLEVISKEFADKFYKALQKLNLRPGRGTRKNRKLETVWASSKQLIDWYELMNSGEREKWLKEEGDEWKYIEGRYESDGSIRSGGSPCICSTDEEELEFIYTLLSNLEIECSKQKQMVYVYHSSKDEFFENITPIIKNRDNESKVRK